MTPEQRQELIRLIEAGEEISPEWSRVLFPSEKRVKLRKDEARGFRSELDVALQNLIRT